MILFSRRAGRQLFNSTDPVIYKWGAHLLFRFTLEYPVPGQQDLGYSEIPI